MCTVDCESPMQFRFACVHRTRSREQLAAQRRRLLPEADVLAIHFQTSSTAFRIPPPAQKFQSSSTFPPTQSQGMTPTATIKWSGVLKRKLKSAGINYYFAQFDVPVFVNSAQPVTPTRSGRRRIGTRKFPIPPEKARELRHRRPPPPRRRLANQLLPSAATKKRPAS